MAKRNIIPDEEWSRQGKLYELGRKHGTQIAKELNVSPQTVYREMKRRGIRKAALVHEEAAAIERYLRQKARHRAHMNLPAARRRQKAIQSRHLVLSVMMKAIIEADKAGDLTTANPIIEKVADAVGVQIHGRKRAKKTLGFN